MQFSFWHEVTRFLIATFGVGFILHLACCLAMATLCPPPEGHGDLPRGGELSKQIQASLLPWFMDMQVLAA
jgi:hypothetical protein